MDNLGEGMTKCERLHLRGMGCSPENYDEDCKDCPYNLDEPAKVVSLRVTLSNHNIYEAEMLDADKSVVATVRRTLGENGLVAVGKLPDGRTKAVEIGFNTSQEYVGACMDFLLSKLGLTWDIPVS